MSSTVGCDVWLVDSPEYPFKTRDLRRTRREDIYLASVTGKPKGIEVTDCRPLPLIVLRTFFVSLMGVELICRHVIGADG